jgi:hypothetical protein
MPKSKLREGMKFIKEVEKRSEQDALFRKNRREFDLGILKREILAKLSNEHQKIYFDNQFIRRYKKRIVWETPTYNICKHCIFSGYFDSGYISDRQVRFLTNSQIDFDEDKDLLKCSYSDLYNEMNILNPGIFEKT